MKKRTCQQIEEHYRIEKNLAEKLRSASRQERQSLYSFLYEELFRRVPHHPQLRTALSAEDSFRSVSFQMRNIRPFLRKDSVFLEIGSGASALSVEVAKFVDKVYAMDITEKNIVRCHLPENFEFVLSDGCSIPLPEKSVDTAYSYQLMEHLHPDDAVEQVRNIYKVLTRGGIYICDTPNRLSGPHDISRYFDQIATGFHLKEYTVTELSDLFALAGFSKSRIHVRVRRIHVCLPVLAGRLCEPLLAKLPYMLRKQLTKFWPLRILLGIRLIGTK
jgi:SAM-dependent methyltransferase